MNHAPSCIESIFASSPIPNKKDVTETLFYSNVSKLNIYLLFFIHFLHIYLLNEAGPRNAVGSTSDSRARGPGLDTRSGHIFSFLLPLIQERSTG